MTEDSKRGHLYAIKIMAVIFVIGALFVAGAMHEPIILIWMVATFFGVFTFANIYSMLYEIGKTKK